MKLKDEWQGTRFPPGAWPFTDSRTGLRFDANAGDLRDRTTQVITHRKANPHVYPTSEPKYLDRDWVRAEIEEFICAKSPELCTDGTIPKPVINVVTLPEQSCPKCQANSWVAQFCSSCGGGRIESYKCTNCGHKI